MGLGIYLHKYIWSIQLNLSLPDIGLISSFMSLYLQQSLKTIIPGRILNEETESLSSEKLAVLGENQMFHSQRQGPTCSMKQMSSKSCLWSHSTSLDISKPANRSTKPKT